MKNKLILFYAIVFILNVIWEFSHYRLYNDLSLITGAPHLLIASLADVLLICLVYFGVFIFNKNFSWIDKPSKKDYFFFMIISLFLAVLIEAISIKAGKWSYKETMPTIFGIGLSPLIQLAITGIVSIWAVNIKNKET